MLAGLRRDGLALGLRDINGLMAKFVLLGLRWQRWRRRLLRLARTALIFAATLVLALFLVLVLVVRSCRWCRLEQR